MHSACELSRRLARLRALCKVTASLLIVSCAADEGQGPVPSDPLDSNPVFASDSGTTSDATEPFAKGGNGKGHGRGRTKADVSVSPSSISLTPESAQRFSATQTLTDGSAVETSFRWTATGGTVDGSGRYTAGSKPGKYVVVATSAEGLSDTAAVTVAAESLVLDHVELTPASSSLAAGDTQQFTAVGKAGDGTTIALTPAYKATGGSITAAGLYSAGQTPGTYRVIATDPETGKADTSAVTVTSSTPTLESVVLTPASVSLVAGTTQQFAASGKRSDGSTAPVTVTFVASGGTISPTGLYTAGSTAGTFRVIATESGGELADTSAVSITASDPTPPPSGGMTYFLADAESGTVTPPWNYTSVRGTGLLPVTSTAQAKYGSRSFKFEIGGGSTDQSYQSFTLQTKPQSSMGCASGHFCTGYYSWYMWVDAGFSVERQWQMILGWMTGVIGAPSPISHLELTNWDGVLQLRYVLKNCAVGLYACPNIPGYQNAGGYYMMTDNSPHGVTAFPRKQWVHIAAYYKMSATNGQVIVWQDGVKIMDLTAPSMNTFGGHSIEPLRNSAGDLMVQFGIYGGPDPTVRRTYVDKFAVTDFRPAP